MILESDLQKPIHILNDCGQLCINVEGIYFQ